MRLCSTCALLSVSLVLSGCGGVYRIRGRDQRPLQGVPFFPHVGVCRQETSYVQPVYRVAVQLAFGDRDITLFEGSITGSALVSPEFRDLRREVTAGDSDPSRIGRAFDALTRNDRYRYHPETPPSDLFVASNRFSTESQVDYSQPLFMNVSRPLMGSASADTRLAPDGTLSEAGAEVKDTTIETVVSALPAKEILTSLVTGDRLRAFGGTSAAATAMQLVLEPQFIKHTYTTLAPAPCPPTAAAIPPGTKGAMYRREGAEK